MGLILLGALLLMLLESTPRSLRSEYIGRGIEGKGQQHKPQGQRHHSKNQPRGVVEKDVSVPAVHGAERDQGETDDDQEDGERGEEAVERRPPIAANVTAANIQHRRDE
eukprot:CAMPEP_0196577306 /NCGR_PEP_ID=MMETSP1081-20130531/6392_1 /TAXON_ID=36882 /ORGANISM="Pyramimonas amylifera, Strain CCMP720" /LENGTH=108 /DNA_ID=CAMNT_0041896191 /DNA_START=333 /DNA_END=659 /DNA_ORIENTATION=-